MAGLDGCFHFFAGAGTVAVADPQTGEVDQREDHIAFRNLSHLCSDIHVVSGHTNGADHALFFIILKALPGSGAHVPVGILPDLVKEEDIYGFQIHFLKSLLDSVLHFFIGGTQTFGTDHREIRIFWRSFYAFQGFAKIGISLVILGGVEEIDALVDGIADQFRTFLQRKIHLRTAHGKNPECHRGHV